LLRQQQRDRQVERATVSENVDKLQEPTQPARIRKYLHESRSQRVNAAVLHWSISEQMTRLKQPPCSTRRTNRIGSRFQISKLRGRICLRVIPHWRPALGGMSWNKSFRLSGNARERWQNAIRDKAFDMIAPRIWGMEAALRP